MKHILIIALVIVLITAGSGAALVRELDPETETRLTDAVLEQFPDAQVLDTRIWDFWNLGRWVFCLTLDLGSETREVYIDVDSGEILTRDEVDQLQADEDEAQENNPVPYPDTIEDPNPVSDQPGDQLPETGSTIYYWLGGIAVLAGAVLLGKRLKRA